LFSILFVVAARGDEPDYSALLKEFLAKEKKMQAGVMADRNATLNAWQRSVNAQSDRLKKISKVTDYKNWLAAKSQLDSLNQGWAKASQAYSAPLPVLSRTIENTKEGDVFRWSASGSTDATDYPIMKIYRVLSPNSMIVRWPPDVYYVETNTKGLVDNQEIHVNFPVYHHDTKDVRYLNRQRKVYYFVFLR
jgi:hypothetical protein